MEEMAKKEAQFLQVYKSISEAVANSPDASVVVIKPMAAWFDSITGLPLNIVDWLHLTVSSNAFLSRSLQEIYSDYTLSHQYFGTVDKRFDNCSSKTLPLSTGRIHMFYRRDNGVEGWCAEIQFPRGRGVLFNDVFTVTTTDGQHMLVKYVKVKKYRRERPSEGLALDPGVQTQWVCSSLLMPIDNKNILIVDSVSECVAIPTNINEFSDYLKMIREVFYESFSTPRKSEAIFQALRMLHGELTQKITNHICTTKQYPELLSQECARRIYNNRIAFKFQIGSNLEKAVLALLLELTKCFWSWAQRETIPGRKEDKPTLFCEALEQDFLLTAEAQFAGVLNVQHLLESCSLALLDMK